MIFNSFNFIILFPFIFLLYYAIPAKYTKARNSYLLIVSYLLYLQWKPIYALILLGITLVTYYIALLITNNTQKKKRKICLLFLLIILFEVGEHCNNCTYNSRNATNDCNNCQNKF